MLTLIAAANTDFDKVDSAMTSWESISQNFYSVNVLSTFGN